MEGCELAVLEGARRILGKRRIRDIVFEDFDPQHSPVTLFLESFGYRVCYLYPGWWKPVLSSVGDAKALQPRTHSEPN